MVKPIGTANQFVGIFPLAKRFSMIKKNHFYSPGMAGSKKTALLMGQTAGYYETFCIVSCFCFLIFCSSA